MATIEAWYTTGGRIIPAIAKSNVPIVKHMGDGSLPEFAATTEVGECIIPATFPHLNTLR